MASGICPPAFSTYKSAVYSLTICNIIENSDKQRYPSKNLSHFDKIWLAICSYTPWSHFDMLCVYTFVAHNNNFLHRLRPLKRLEEVIKFFIFPQGWLKMIHCLLTAVGIDSVDRLAVQN